VLEVEAEGIMPIFDEQEFNRSYIPIDFIVDNTIQFRTFNCNWCGKECDDVHITLSPEEPLHVCVECIVKTLDKVLGRCKNGGEE